jgi:hypothetical protein
VNGFSIHANVAVQADNRYGLERLCRYGLRAAFSQERISMTDDGQVLFSLRKPWPTPDGVQTLTFEPTAFLRRLSPLIPPPFSNLIRYHGLFAPNAKGRDLLPPAPISKTGIRPEACITHRKKAAGTGDGGIPDGPSSPPTSVNTDSESMLPAKSAFVDATNNPSRPTRKRLPWSDLLRRVFGCDVLVCPKCLGPLTVIAYLTDPKVVNAILTHLALPAKPEPIAPARLPAQCAFFDDLDDVSENPKATHPSRSRAPPDEARANDDLEFDPNDSTDDSFWGP